MENYFYKCPVCGFVHLVPAYWVNFAPEQTIEFPHLNLKSGELCLHTILSLSQEDE